MIAKQTEFDWLIGHALPWLRVDEAARSVRCSDDHVINLFADGSIDFVIDIRTTGSDRPTYRIFRPALDRWLTHGRQHNFRQLPPTNFNEAISGYLNTQRNILASWEVAHHLRCTDRHVRNLGPDIALDISSASSSRSFPRTTRTQLIQFIQRRKI